MGGQSWKVPLYPAKHRTQDHSRRNNHQVQGKLGLTHHYATTFNMDCVCAVMGRLDGDAQRSGCLLLPPFLSPSSLGLLSPLLADIALDSFSLSLSLSLRHLLLVSQ